MSTSEKSRILKIKEGKEFKAYIHKRGEWDEQDWFLDKYLNASEIFMELYNNCESEKATVEEQDIDLMLHEDYEYQNNIIAFCGDRGTGKTSVMLNFGNAIVTANEQDDKRKVLPNLPLDIGEAYIANNIIIDPTMLDNHSILDIIVATMYGALKEKWDKYYKEVSGEKFEKIRNDYMNIIKLFQIVYRNLSLINNPQLLMETEYDTMGSIEKLTRLGESARIKESVKSLVEKYLEFMKMFSTNKNVTKENANKHFLVIEIDDVDLCDKNAYKILEEIRKYLIIPKVVILMAVRMEQLELCIEEENYKHYPVLRKEYSDKIRAEVGQITSRYLLKLIPEKRRIWLDSKDFSRYNVNVQFIEEKSTEEQVPERLFDSIVRLMKEKMGIQFFVNDIDAVVPQNLRGIINLLVYLKSMSSIPQENSIESEHLRSGNISRVLDYFRNVLIREGDITSGELELLQKLYDCAPSRMNSILAKEKFFNATFDGINEVVENYEKEYCQNKEPFWLYVVYAYTLKWSRDYLHDTERLVRELGKNVWGDIIREIIESKKNRGRTDTIKTLIAVNNGEDIFNKWLDRNGSKMTSSPNAIEEKVERENCIRSMLKMFLFAPMPDKETYISKTTASFIDSWIVQELDSFLVNVVNIDYVIEKSGIRFIFGPDENVDDILGKIKEELEEEYRPLADFLKEIYCNPIQFSLVRNKIKKDRGFREKTDNLVYENAKKVLQGIFGKQEDGLIHNISKMYADIRENTSEDEYLQCLLDGTETAHGPIVSMQNMRGNNRNYGELSRRIKAIINNIARRNHTLKLRGESERYNSYKDAFMPIYDFYLACSEMNPSDAFSDEDEAKYKGYIKAVNKFLDDTENN